MTSLHDGKMSLILHDELPAIVTILDIKGKLIGVSYWSNYNQRWRAYRYGGLIWIAEYREWPDPEEPSIIRIKVLDY